jgi:hypothetical protein
LRLNPLFLSALLLVLPMPLVADTVTLTSTGSGWCSSVYGCNNTNVNLQYNYIASPYYHGIESLTDWFAFNLGGITQPITSATFTVYNPESIITGSDVFAIAGFSDFSYGGLVSGPEFGSVTVTQALQGQNVVVTFNAAGIAALNADLGGEVVFGGELETTNQADEILGNSPDIAANLEVTTSDASPSAVPEPSSWILMGSGVMGVAGAIRRRLVA